MATIEPASFRDPCGFIYRNPGGPLLRQINPEYAEDYSRLIESGLYADLVKMDLLVSHETAPLSDRATERAWRVIRPREIPFISYPYEWSFSQLKAAALLTLEIQQRALRFGMSLRDASAFNVQFEGEHAVFIDTLSFERYHPGTAWVAYGQFCRHFLAPLALMSRIDVRLNRLLRLFIDGIPLDLAVRMLPWRARLRFGLLAHLYLHAWSVRRHESTSRVVQPLSTVKKGHVSETGLQALLENLKATVSRVYWQPSATEWRDYYADNSYTNESLELKKQFVAQCVDRLHPQRVWDLGANTGVFSRIAADRGAYTVAFDIDSACVEMHFLECQKLRIRNVLPLCLDLTNPSPGIGWAHTERRSHIGRGPVDLAMALALIHHLRISNNVPLTNIAEYFHRICRHLLVEFVPKNDPQVQRLLRSREDIFCDYTQEGFEHSFQNHFGVLESLPLEKDGRILYLMEARTAI